MNLEPLIIDTCVFRDSSFIQKLKNYHGRKCISPITYVEMQIFLIGKKKKEQFYFDDLLKRAKIEIMTLRKEEAVAATVIGIGNGEFNKNSRDYMIASHAYTAPWIVITYNKRDFIYLGERVLNPDEFKKSKNI